MMLMDAIRVWVCALLLVAGFHTPVLALPAETQQSVVSVLPVWPGRAQGGLNGPPGVAPEGSGVVLESGIIATAWHVIEPATRIEVRLFDGRILPATLIGHDVQSDIALLRVDAALRPFERAPGTAVADRVCSIGNAFGLGLSVTCGVVSALHVSNAGFNPVEDFVQTDAALNPGSSGGALVDDEGRLVGMVSAIFASESDTNTGVGFAVSAELLVRVTDALLEAGEVRYPQPGWRLATASRDDLARIAAPVVRALEDGGVAQSAGILPGDLILQIGERRITSPRDATAALAILPMGTPEIAVTLDRAGRREEVILPLQTVRPNAAPQEAVPLGDCPHPQPVCQMRQAVFPVSAFDPLGSATRIGPRLLVTNRHIVGHQSDAVVHTPDGPRGARVVPSSYRGDLVLLEVDGLPDTGVIPGLAEATTDASEFFVVGADVARQEVRVFDPGTLLAGPAPQAELGRLHVTATMQPGVSGGALVDETGTLVGIAVGGGDGRFEAIPLRDIKALLKGREDARAGDVTTRLGEAFKTCAASIDALRVSRLEDDCTKAMNHGQLLEAGRTVSQTGDFDAAARLLAQAVKQVPNSVNARLSLLISLQRAARFEEMVEHARVLLASAPSDPAILLPAIQAGVWGGDATLAEEAYQLLASENPRLAEAARRFIDNAPPAPARRE